MRLNRYALTAILLFPNSLAVYAQDLLGETRSVIQEWVKIEQLISLEKKQWREENASITDILTILSVEQRELSEQIALAQEVASRADEERSLLVEKLTSYQDTSELLATRISDYERQLSLIEPYLPQTLSEELAPRFARINSSFQGSTLSLSERAQIVLSIMSEIESFDSTLTLTTEIINNSQPVEVRVLYFGLSRAFYVTDNGLAGGYGIPAETGWRWQAANDLSATVSRAIDIYETRVSLQLISLPMQVER